MRAVGSSVPSMRESQRQLIDHTLRVWQPKTARTLTLEDAREIIENVTGFVQILQEWQTADDAPEGGAEREGDAS